MVQLNDLTAIINNINWSRTSHFNIDLRPKHQSFASKTKWGDVNKTSDDINICLKDVVLPQYSGQFNEEIINGKWHFSRAADKAYNITLTFKDFNNGTLYRKFVNCLQVSRGNYSDACDFIIKVYLYNLNNINICVLDTSEAQISDVSQITLSNENNEILEFSVEFKMNQPKHSDANLANIQFYNASFLSEDSIEGKFSNWIKNGLSKVENGILNSFNNLLKSWD